MLENSVGLRRTFLLFALLSMCESPLAAQSITKSDAYYDEIARGLGIDPNEPDIWDIGNATYSTDQGIVGMYAYYRKAPTIYDGILCVLEKRSRIAKIDEGKFYWGRESIGFQVWLSSVQRCDIRPADDIPPHSLVAGDVTLAEAKIVLLNEHYLIQELVTRLRSASYQYMNNYRLTSIGKTDRLYGQVLTEELISASFAAPGKSTGPSVFLRIEGDLVVIEEIGGWIS